MPRAPDGGRSAEGSVVVTGMGVVCSIGTGVVPFGAALRDGRSGIEAPVDGDGPSAANLRDFDPERALDALEILPRGLRRAAWRATFRSPRALQAATFAALEAWGDAGLHAAPIDGDRLGIVVAGSNLSGRLFAEHLPRFARNPAHLSPRFALQVLDTDHVGTLSQILGITGEGYTVGGASASGNVGIINGARLVAPGAVDACLVVGAMTDLSPIERQALLQLGAMAPGRRMAYRPFDAAQRGFVAGQGAACLVLEASASAARRDVSVLATLAGYALKLDGNALADPCVVGEAEVMRRAMRRAGRRPEQIDYVNAHGTGSPLGDETEVRALHRAFGTHARGPAINTTKALTGHCLGAAGVVEAVATVIQMQGGFVHPQPALVQPIDDRLAFAGTEATSTEIVAALSNGFGFGGFNSSIVFVR